MLRYLFILLVSIVPFSSFFASHVPGANITYECLGNDQYLVTLTLFEDCGTAFIANTPENITITNDCGITGLTSATLNNTIFQQEVSQLCASQLPFSECSGGAMPGIYMHQWQGVVTLPGNCDSWQFSYSNCCRNASTNTVGTGNNYYFESTLNNLDAVCNSSPTVTTQMIPYICVNQPLVYNLGIYEPDGNILNYSLVSAAVSTTASVPYQPGYTGTSPIPGITINGATGDLSFTPTQVGNFVVVVLVEEFDNNGNQVGSLVQDFQFEVINCPANTNPVEPTGISNFSGDGTQLSNHEIEVCPGDSFCFELTFTDLNSGDSIFISSNLNVALPGATFNQLTWQSPATAEICWTATNSVPANTSVVFNARDNACPMFGITFFPLSVTINTGTSAGPDVILCAGDTTTLNASGGSSFVWNSLPGGDTLIVGNNFECNTCATSYALPSITTQYEVTSDLSVSGACSNKDTVQVTVVPDFSYSLTQSATNACLGSDVALEIITNPVGSYDILWTPATGLDDPTIANPTITTNVPGIWDYAVSITSPLGCTRYDTISVNVQGAYNPDFSLLTSSTNVNCGDTVFFDVDILSGSPPICGLSANNLCLSTPSVLQVGTPDTQNTPTSYPAPFGNWYRNAKHQFLFTAAELTAAGVFPGKITEISWDVIQVNGANVYYDYSVSMGCTSVSSLSAFETGLVNVFSPQNINVVMGANSLVLTSAYEWDGVSNLIVEICYDNLHLNFTNNSITPQTNTTFVSSGYFRDDVQNACLANGFTGANVRPVISFTVCSVEADINNFSFNWQSNPDLVDDPASDSTFAVISDDGQFEVFITNLVGGCMDSIAVDVTALCCGFEEVLIQNISCAGGSDGALVIVPSSNHGVSYDVTVAEVVSGNQVFNQNGVVDTAFVNGLPAGAYQIAFTTSDGCLSDTIVNINEPVVFFVPIEGDSVICFGDSLQLTANGANNYTWLSAANFSNNTLDTVYFTGTTSQMIYLEAQNAAGCLSVDSLFITVHDLPTVSISNDTTICRSDTITLQANGGISFDWSPNYNISTLSGNIVNVSPLIDTIYQVVVTSLEGCKDSAEVLVAVQSLPVIDAGPDVGICFGDTTILAGSGGVNYYWILGDSLQNENSSSTSAWPTSTNDYVLQGEDLLGCINYDTLTITVNDLPDVDAGSDKWVCPGGTIQLEGNSSDGIIYSWMPTTDVDSPNDLITDASPSDSMTYYLTVENAFGCLNVDSMFVYAGGPVPTQAGLGDTICEGDSILIGGAPTAVTGTIFNWLPSGAIVDPTQGNPIVHPTVDTWFVVETSNDTCSGIDSVFIKVNPYPLANAGLDVQICIGDTTQLMATGGVQYSWNTTVNLSDSAVSDPLAFPQDTTMFVVSVTDLLGCSQSDSVWVVVNPLPLVNAGTGDTICFGDTIQLHALGGVGYSWSPQISLSDPLISNPSAFPTVSTDYLVEVTDTNGCVNSDGVRIVVNDLPIVSAGPDLEMCLYDSIQLSATGALSYIWSPDSTLNSGIISDPFSSAQTSQIFRVEGTDVNGCINYDTVSLIVHNLPVIVASSDVQICIGDTANLQATGAIDYSWSPSGSIVDPLLANIQVFPNDTTTYFVVGIDANGCENMDSLIVTVNPLPNVFAGNDVDICRGDSTMLLASGGDSYNWIPLVNILGAQTATPVVFPDTTSSYVVEVADSNACVNWDTVVVNVFRVSTIPDTAICLLDSVQLNVFGSPGNQFSWTPVDGLSDAQISNPWASPEVTTEYTVTVADVAGCIDQASVNITVNNIPMIAFSYILIPSCDGVEMIFSDSSEHADQYYWSFGNGEESTESNPSTLFDYGIDASVDLTLLTNLGCDADTSFMAKLDSFDDFYGIYIPNVFTPNGDGENDYFWVQVPGTLSECLDLKIYNRWGQMVFKSYGGVTTWDGKNATGKDVPDGTYLYTIEIEDLKYEGTLTIFR